MEKYYMEWAEVWQRASAIKNSHRGFAYGIPRGGAIVAGIMGNAIDCWEKADYIVDDIYDSGKTAERYSKMTGKEIAFLVDKRKKEDADLGWVVFPWEKRDETSDVEDTVIRQLEFIGEDPTREGLLETPKRVLKALRELTGGYAQDPCSILNKTFNVACDEMVIVKDIEYWSLCEHHMLPFHGTATVAYIPSGSVVGLSKIPRVVEAYARRLQVQERLTNQIANAVDEALDPLGVAVVVTGSHLCCAMRGAKKAVTMKTSALRGLLKEDGDARAEFLKLAGSD